MNPFSRPSSTRQVEQPISPRTIPHGFNARIGNSTVNSHGPFLATNTNTGKRLPRSTSGSYRPRTVSHQPGEPLCPLRTKNLTYEGRTLGKRAPQHHVRPPRAKRPCLASERLVRESPSPFPLLSNPNHTNHTTNATKTEANLASLNRTFSQDQYLRLLPINAISLTQIVWPPPDMTPYELEHGYGNDSPGGYPTRRDLVHPLLRRLVLPQASSSSSYYTHSAYPQLWRALQLATRFLSNRHSLALFHRILFAEEGEELTCLQRESEFYGVEMYHLSEKDGGLTEEQRVQTTDTLAALGQHISICFAATQHWAQTERVEPPDVTGELHARLNRSYRDLYQDSRAASSSSPPAAAAAAAGATTQDTLPYHPEALRLDSPTPASVSMPGPVADEAVRRTVDVNLLHTRSLAFDKANGNAATGASCPTERGGLRGTNARITLNPVFLRYLHAEAIPAVPSHVKLYVLFFLAVTLVHEIAHAVWMCRVPPPPPPLAVAAQWRSPEGRSANHTNTEEEDVDMEEPPQQPEYEPFIHDDRKPELGRAWEASVFGGGSIEPLGQLSGGCARTIDDIDPAATANGGDGAVQWGDLFSLGLGCRAWPDTRETFVRAKHGTCPVPLARLWDDDDEADGMTVDRRQANSGSGQTPPQPQPQPQPKSGARHERLRILPWRMIRNFFDAEFWTYVDGQDGGLKAYLRREIEQCVLVQRENPDWNCVRMARAVDDDDWPDDELMDDEEEDEEEEQ